MTPCRTRCVEQPGQHHRVGDVADEELVEAQHAASPAISAAMRGSGSGSSRSPWSLRVHVLHEAVEMLAPRGHAGMRVEQVHQEGLAAADAAPEVEAAHRDRLGRGSKTRCKPLEPRIAVRRRALQARSQVVELGDRLFLRRVRLVAVSYERGVVRRREVVPAGASGP